MLRSVGNSAVRATIQNTGYEALRLFTPGSLLDSSPIEKTEIFSGCKFILSKTRTLGKTHGFADLFTADLIPFNGIRLHLITTNIPEDAFRTLAVNESIEAEWDPAEVHDLSAGGRFDYQVSGQFLVTAPNSTAITGTIPFHGTLSPEVDGTTAAGVHHGYQAKMKRSTMGETCTPTQSTQVRAAEKVCNELALQAAAVAKRKNRNTDRYVAEYFRSADTATRAEVEKVLRKTAQECSPKGTFGEINCDNTRKRCNRSIYAFTVVNKDYNWIAYCPEYFQELQPQAKVCHANDRAITTLHEVTHVPQIKGTKDYAYEYPGVKKLGRDAAINNADSYALFANGEHITAYPPSKTEA